MLLRLLSRTCTIIFFVKYYIIFWHPAPVLLPGKSHAFGLWCWRRLLRVPWTARRSNQSILKEISPGCSLEGLMLKLKLQYFGHLMWRVHSLEKTLMLGGIGGRRRRGQQRMRWLDGITDSMDAESEWIPGVGDGQGGLVCCDSWGRKDSDTTEWLKWTEHPIKCIFLSQFCRWRTSLLIIPHVSKVSLLGLAWFTCQLMRSSSQNFSN